MLCDFCLTLVSYYILYKFFFCEAKMRKIVSLLFIFIASTILLAGCNMVDSNGSSSTEDLDFYGVAAIGAPAAGYTVYLKSADGKVFESVADGNGGYTISAKNIQAPFLLWFEMADGEKIYAVTFEEGIVNLNAITSALTKAAYTLSGENSDEDINPSSFDEQSLSSAEGAVTKFMEPVLELYGVDKNSFDPLKMPDFVADGFEVDGILDDFHIGYDSASEEVIITLKNSDVPLGSLDMEAVKNNQENIENINSADLTDLNTAIVEKVANSITFTSVAGENTSANNVITSLNLFTSWKNGTAISWAIGDTAIISADGTVSRPVADTEVLLTATVTKNGVSADKSFSVLVKADDGGSDGGDSGGDGGDSGDSSLGEITLETILGNNSSSEVVIFDMNLMTELSDGTAVSWKSSDAEYISDEGKLLKRPLPSEGTKTVTLTANRTKDALAAEDIYMVTIPSIVPERMSYGTYIKEDGSIWFSGEASSYEVGSNKFISNVFVQEETSSYDWVTVSAGNSYTLAIKSDGTLWGWGYNYSKQINDSAENFIDIPVQIGTDNDWVDVSVGVYGGTSAAIKADGTLWLWGSSEYSMIPAAEKGAPVGTPVQEASMASDWVDVKVGYPYVTGLKSDGTIWSWGSNYFGGFGTAVSEESTTAPVQESTKADDWVAIDALSTTTAVKKDGTMWFWGGSEIDFVSSLKSRAVAGKGGPSYYPVESPMQEPSLSSDWVKPFAGISMGGLKYDGSIWSFGSGTSCVFGNGLCEDSLEMVQESTKGTGWVDVKSIGTVIYAINSDGSLWGWGQNYDGELGTGYGLLRLFEPTLYDKKTFVKTDGNSGMVCGLEEDGDIWCKDYSSPFFYQIEGKWKDFVSDGSGAWGIKLDDTLWFWGRDNDGYFTGTKEYTLYEAPVQVGTDTWKQIDVQRHDAAANFMMGIQTDGTLWAQGTGAYYDGTEWVTTYEPVKIDSGEWNKVVTGHKRLAIKSDGTLWTWSSGWSTGLGNVYPSADEFPVQVGTDTWKDVDVSRGQYGIGIKSDGKLYGWGYSVQSFLFNEGGSNDYLTPTLMSSTDTDWEKVSIYYSYFSALKSDGSLYTAGQVKDYPVYMQGLGVDTPSTNTMRKVEGTFSDVFFMKDMVYGLGTDGNGYIWGRTIFEYSEPNPIKIMD
jgi:alpha-tubulin suppressor-like RCC1 family protein